MKTKIIPLIGLLLLSFGCSFNTEEENSEEKKENTENTEPADPTTPITYPLLVAMTDYALPDAAAQSLKEDSLYRIHSQAEFQAYFPDHNAEGIDFDTHSLLVARGKGRFMLTEVEKQLTQLSAEEYRLELGVRMDTRRLIDQNWLMAAQVAKISPEASIEWVVEYDRLLRQNLIGRWQLKTSSINYNYDYLNRIITEYSNPPVIYDFQTESKLLITGTLPNDLFMDISQGILNLPEGEYSYNYTVPDEEEYLRPMYFPQPPVLRIGNNLSFTCTPLTREDRFAVGKYRVMENHDFIQWSVDFVQIK
jgi:hypothetical protein